MSEALSMNEARLESGGGQGNSVSDHLFRDAYAPYSSSSRADAPDRAKGSNDAPQADDDTGFLKPSNPQDNAPLAMDNHNEGGDAPQAPEEEPEEDNYPNDDCRIPDEGDEGEEDEGDQGEEQCEDGDGEEGEGEEGEEEGEGGCEEGEGEGEGEGEEEEEREWDDQLIAKNNTQDNGQPKRANSISIPAIRGYA